MEKIKHILIVSMPGSDCAGLLEAMASAANPDAQQLLSRSSGSDTARVVRSLFKQVSGQRLLVARAAEKELISDALSATEDSCVIAVFERPHRCLASTENRAAAELLSAQWQHAAKAVVDARRTSPMRVYAVDAEELRMDLDGFRSVIERLSGAKGLTPPSLAIGAADPVRMALAHAEWATDRKIRSLVEEIEATCHPLSDSAAGPVASNNSLPLFEEAWKSWESEHKRRSQDKATVDQLSSEAVSLRDRIKTLQADLAKKEDSFAEYLRQRQAQADTQKKADAALKEAMEENELILLQLHQVQEELECYFLENRKLSSRPSSAPSLSEGPCLEYDDISLGTAVSGGAHKHLDFTLENARLSGRHLGRLALRLVEHHGHPGLLVFHAGSPPSAPLWNWKESGSEDGRPFMLVVPQDAAGRDYLRAATTSTLALLKGAVAAVAAALTSGDVSPGTKDPFWRGVAQAFLDRCRDIPVRLHYDDVLASQAEGAYHFRVQNAWVPGRYLPQLQFQWDGASLTFSCDHSSGLPLTGWPREQNGDPRQKAIFDLSGSADRAETRRLWSGLSDSDQSFLLGLVAELPNFAYHLEQKNPDKTLDAVGLRKTAKAMRRRARRLGRSGGFPWIF